MSRALSRDSQQAVRVEQYEKGGQVVFGVYRRSRHWERLEVVQGKVGPVWLEKTSDGGSSRVAGKRKRWLENIRRNRNELQKVVRFPRTQKDHRGKELIQALSEAHAKGENESVQRHLSELQSHVSSMVFSSRDTGARSAWDALPRFDPTRVPTTTWLIDSFLAERSIQLLFGEPGSFKTTLCMFAAKAVSSGESFLGMKARARRVLILDYENPAGVIRDRGRDLGLELPDNPNLVIWDRFVKGFMPDPAHPWLENVIRECVLETGHGPWIIFDSFSSLLPPGEGGESTGQVAPIYAQIRRLVDLGATATILDHSKKYYTDVVYGGRDKEAKADSIHNIQIFENQTRPQNPIITVESRLKRFTPEGIGTFAFEVISRQNKEGKWHLSRLQLAPNPAELLAERNREILRDLIRKNPNAGQQELGRLASEIGNMSRDQAVKILKDGISKYWLASKTSHGKTCYVLI
jgi:hypothetical protein